LTNARLRARQDAAQIAAAPEDELCRFLAQVHHALASAGPLSEKARAHAPLSVAAAAQATACAFDCTHACAHATFSHLCARRWHRPGRRWPTPSKRAAPSVMKT